MKKIGFQESLKYSQWNPMKNLSRENPWNNPVEIPWRILLVGNNGASGAKPSACILLSLKQASRQTNKKQADKQTTNKKETNKRINERQEANKPRQDLPLDVKICRYFHRFTILRISTINLSFTLPTHTLAVHFNRSSICIK